MVRCHRCGAEIKSLNKLRKWCVDCRRDLINERARMKTQARRYLLDNNMIANMEKEEGLTSNNLDTNPETAENFEIPSKLKRKSDLMDEKF